MKIVVTGAKGFVGSVFALRALERGHEVIALDDGSRGLNPIEDKIGDAFRIHNCMEGFRSAMADQPVDAVAHFAAATGSLERPLEELLAYNVGMTQAVYRDAVALGAKAFVWPTTSLALGVPDSPYVESKEQALTWLRTADADNQISVPVRFFNVAGAYKGLSEKRKNEVHLIPGLMQHYKAGTSLVINGDDYEDTVDGTPSRDFVHVLDVVEYLLDIIEAKVGGKPALVQPHSSDGAVWLGTGSSTTVKQVVALFEQFVGSLQTIQGPRRAYDCGSLTVAIDQASQFYAQRRGLTPAWVSIRDEMEALVGFHETAASAEVVPANHQPVYVLDHSIVVESDP